MGFMPPYRSGARSGCVKASETTSMLF
jgi:hypothetical protein